MSDSQTAVSGLEHEDESDDILDAEEAASSIDWPQLYIEEVGAPQARLKTMDRQMAVNRRVDCGLDNAEEVVVAALENGDLVRSDNGFIPPDEHVPDGWDTLRSGEHVVEETADVTEAVSKLADAVGDLANSDVDSDVVRVMEQNAAVMECMADEMQSIKGGVDEAKELAQGRSDEERDLKRAVTEMQARELQNGASFARSNVDVDRLENDLGLDVDFFGGDDRYVRLNNTESGDEKNVGADMPDASEMCQAEQWRQMWRRGIISESDLTAGEYRAMRLWDELEKIAQVGNTGHIIRSGKARAALLDGGDGPIAKLAEDSQVTATNRAMKYLATQYATDVLDSENRDGTRVITFDMDDLTAAKKPLYASSEVDGGDVLLPNAGGVS